MTADTKTVSDVDILDKLDTLRSRIDLAADVSWDYADESERLVAGDNDLEKSYRRIKTCANMLQRSLDLLTAQLHDRENALKLPVPLKPLRAERIPVDDLEADDDDTTSYPVHLTV
jgi:hypothetical protein